MTTTTAFRPRMVQHGLATISFPNTLWTDYETDIGSLVGEQSFAATGGFYNQVYDFDLRFDPVRGLPLDPPNIFTRADGGLFLIFAVETDLTAVPGTTVFQFLNLLDQPLWEDNNTTLDNTAALQTIGTDAERAAAWSLNANGTTYDFSFDIDMNTLYSERPAFSIQSNFRDTKWQGRFSLQFAGTGANILVRDPTLYDRGFMAAQSVPQYTGWSGSPATLGRPVPDMRTGLPAFAQDLVEDQYLKGIWTSDDQADPDDPRNIRPVEFPDEEGTKRDDVPV